MLMIYWETIDFAQAIKRVEEEKKTIETHSTLRSAWILHFQLLLYRLEWICNGFCNVFRVLISTMQSRDRDIKNSSSSAVEWKINRK